MKYRVTAAGQTYEIEVEPNHLVRVNGRPVYVDLEQVGGLPVYTLALDDAEKLVERLGSRFPKERIYCSRTSPVISTHTGPGLLAVAVMGDQG